MSSDFAQMPALAGRGRRTKFVIYDGILASRATRTFFAVIVDAYQASRQDKHHAPEEWQVRKHREPPPRTARPRPKKQVDARSLPRRPLLLRLHPRNNPMQLLRPRELLGVAPAGPVQDPREDRERLIH